MYGRKPSIWVRLCITPLFSRCDDPRNIAQKWSYLEGIRKDDILKQHPFLVQLSEKGQQAVTVSKQIPCVPHCTSLHGEATHRPATG